MAAAISLLNVSAVAVAGYITYSALTAAGPSPTVTTLPSITSKFWGDDKMGFQLDLDGFYRLEPLDVKPISSNLMQMKLTNGLLETGGTVIMEKQQTLFDLQQRQEVQAKQTFVEADTFNQ